MTPGLTTLGQIILYAQRRTDMVNSNVVSPDEWIEYANQAQYRLYDLLIQKFSDDYYVAPPYSFQPTANNDTYPLPADLYKLLGVDSNTSSGPNSSITLKPFMFSQRNQYAYPLLPSGYGTWNLQYRLQGNTIKFIPLPNGGQQLTLWYIPRLTLPVQTATITCLTPALGDVISLNGQNFTAGTTFAIGPGNAGTAANLAAIINSNYPLGYLNAINPGPLVATASANVVTLSLFDPTLPFTMTWGVSNADFLLSPTMATLPATSTWSNVIDGFSGWEEFIMLDMAVHALDKQDLPTAVLQAQLESIIGRVEAAAENRDAGAPFTMVDSEQLNADNGFGSGGWGSSGGGFL